MEIWLYYALMAAIFISIRDIISLDFIKRYDYIQYMVIANIFQAFQTFLLSNEALPDNLQKILDDQLAQKTKPSLASIPISDSDRLPFEPKSKK